MQLRGVAAKRAKFLADMLAPERRTRVVDVGANPITPVPYKGLLSLGLCEVWGFEPQSDAFEELQKIKGPFETYLPYAVGKGGEGTLHLTKNGGLTSLLEPNEATYASIGHFRYGGQVLGKLPLATRSLDEMTELPPFDLLKIDVQGGEVDVFTGAPRHLAHAVAVISEVAAIPLYKDQPLLDAQMAALRAHGMHLHKILFFKSLKFKNDDSAVLPEKTNRSQLCDGDAVFVRGVIGREGMETEQLKHLAILADGVFQSFDLAVVALSELVRRGAIKQKSIARYLAMLDGVPVAEGVKA